MMNITYVSSVLDVSSLDRLLAVIRHEHAEATVSVSSSQFKDGRTRRHASLNPELNSSVARKSQQDKSTQLQILC
jgi:hypothetical protein